jgi:hypothetical protein
VKSSSARKVAMQKEQREEYCEKSNARNGNVRSNAKGTT